MARQAGAGIHLPRWPWQVMFIYALDTLHQLWQSLQPEFLRQALQLPRRKLIEEATLAGLDFFDSNRGLVRQVVQTLRFAAEGSRLPRSRITFENITTATYLRVLSSRRYSRWMLITVTVSLSCAFMLNR